MSLLAITGAVLLALVFLVVLVKGIRTVDQATVAVVTRFGKYRKLLQPGLNVINPFTSKITRVVPIQNQTATLTFAAITQDQAAVHFTSTIIFTVKDHSEATVLLVAFRFIDDVSFQTAMTSAVEASVREYVAGKKQSEILGLRQDIVDHAKSTLDEQLASWGYLLVDLTVNDISFDPEVMASMSRVVSAKNAQTAAEYEGQALLITRTKQAEAEGRALVIAAENEAEAARLRGEGIAKFRRAVAEGFAESAAGLHDAGLDSNLLAFSLWTETVRDVAVLGKGNTIFLDGGAESLQNTMRRLEGFLAPAPDADQPPGKPGTPAGARPAASPPPAGQASSTPGDDANGPRTISAQDVRNLADGYRSGSTAARELVQLLRDSLQQPR